MTVTQQRLTLEEFLRLPEEEVALEYEEGTVTQKVSPKVHHGRLQAVFAALLNGFAGPNKLGMAFTETRATYGGYSRVPDVVFYVWDRLQRTPQGKLVQDFTTPPDIAVEIVSPEQSVTSQVRRCVWYVENGVRVAILVDPGDESVLVFRPQSNPIAVRGDEQIDIQDVLPGFQLTAKELFDSLMVD